MNRTARPGSWPAIVQERLFHYCGECDLRPVFNAQIGAGGGHFSYWGGEAHSIVDGNFPYKGALKIVSVPKGSTW